MQRHHSTLERLRRPESTILLNADSGGTRDSCAMEIHDAGTPLDGVYYKATSQRFFLWAPCGVDLEFSFIVSSVKSGLSRLESLQPFPESSAFLVFQGSLPY